MNIIPLLDVCHSYWFVVHLILKYNLLKISIILQLSNRPIRISIFLFLLTSCMFVNAQDSIVKVHEFVISAQVRPEFEMRYGYHKPTISGLKPAALISQRNRIGLNYNYKQLLSLRLIPQYIFIWGQDGLSQGKSTQNTFSLFLESITVLYFHI